MAASVTMMASSLLLGGVSIAQRPSVDHRRSLVVAKAAANAEAVAAAVGARESNHGADRREVVREGGNRRLAMLAAAAVAGCAIGWRMGAVGGEEPAPGTPEAKKKYAAVCVTMPTAKICRK